MQKNKTMVILCFVLCFLLTSTSMFCSQVVQASPSGAAESVTGKKSNAPMPVDREKVKADFSYEMAQLTAKVVATPNNNVIQYKVTVAEGIDLTVSKLLPMLPQEARSEFGAEMSQLKNKIYGNTKLNIEKSKADFSYEIAQLTSKYMPKADREVVSQMPTSAGVAANKGTAPPQVSPSSSVESNAASGFRAEMSELTAKVTALPNNNIIKFKVTVAEEIDQTLEKLAPMISQESKSDFTNEMNQIKNKIYGNPKLNIVKAKTDFTNDIALLTTKYMTKANKDPAMASGRPALAAGPVMVNNTTANKTATQENGKTQPAPTTTSVTPQSGTGGQSQDYVANPTTIGYTKPLTPESYSSILKDLMNVGGGKKNADNKIKVDGNIRVHYAVNNGAPAWGYNTSGVRARLGLETKLSQDWRINGLIEAKKSFLNYYNEMDYRLYVTGKIGTSILQAGAFGYYMADGNIYDSKFTGARMYFGGPIKYTFSYGDTDYSKQTYVATARYDDLDYNLEAGYYNYQLTEGNTDRNTILNLAGNYKFSNYSLGAMMLIASKKDRIGNNFGYVLSMNYGDLKTWRPGTYDIWARYYSQPRYTYIAPTMNGRGGWMQGFRGFGIGVNYTIVENLVGSLEYYTLNEITSGATGNTLWGSLTGFF